MKMGEVEACEKLRLADRLHSILTMNRQNHCTALSLVV